MARDLETTRIRREPHIWLLIEVIFVSTMVVGAVAATRCLSEPWASLAIPWILVAGALLPTFACGRGLDEMGVRRGRLRQDGVLLCGIVLGTLGVGVVARVIVGSVWGESAVVIRIREGQWLSWLFFQAVYVALPEELFFRGYLVSAGVRLWGRNGARGSGTEYGVMMLSAGLFAVCHVLSLGTSIFLLTFFPGLLFAWGYVRMQTIVAPVLLHIAANVGFAMMTTSVA